jgi:hypothetical protein
MLSISQRADLAIAKDGLVQAKCHTKGLLKIKHNDKVSDDERDQARVVVKSIDNALSQLLELIALGEEEGGGPFNGEGIPGHLGGFGNTGLSWKEGKFEKKGNTNG